jgi:hypothetical protein
VLLHHHLPLHHHLHLELGAHAERTHLRPSGGGEAGGREESQHQEKRSATHTVGSVAEGRGRSVPDLARQVQVTLAESEKQRSFSGLGPPQAGANPTRLGVVLKLTNRGRPLT